MSLHIAIVGSGPAGCFIAELLSRKLPGCHLDILERQPVPFGLVRTGVAPDHQGTKNVTRQFERTLQKNEVRLITRINVGTDIPYDTLRQYYDLVIFATGASQDKPLTLPGSNTEGIYGSRHFVGWYNAGLEQPPQSVALQGPSVAIIGHGNVALDIARVLAKTPDEHATSDICEQALQQITQAGIRDIYLIGRGTPEQARFTPPELAELTQLDNALPVIQDQSLPDSLSDDSDPRSARAKAMNLELFRQFAANGQNPDSAAKPRIHLLFNHQPEAINSRNERISDLTCRYTDNNETIRTVTLPVNTLVSAIGYTSEAVPGVPFDETKGHLQHENGCIEPGVYALGWCSHGPRGVIPTNRTDAVALSKRILSDLEQGHIQTGKPGAAALDQWIQDQQLDVFYYPDWQWTDQQEIAAATPPAPRKKFRSSADILKAHADKAPGKAAEK